MTLFPKIAWESANDKGEAIGAIIKLGAPEHFDTGCKQRDRGRSTALIFSPRPDSATQWWCSIFHYLGGLQLCLIWAQSWPIMIPGCITKCITISITWCIWAMRRVLSRNNGSPAEVLKDKLCCLSLARAGLS